MLSLWQVDDTVTTLLMTRFYQNLLGKRAGLEKPLPKAEALREAKLWLRNLTRKDFDTEVSVFAKFHDIGGGVKWPMDIRRERIARCR